MKMDGIELYHVAISLPKPFYPAWIPETRDGLLATPVRVAADGTVAVPAEPGLGIHLDEDQLARYGEKYLETTSRGVAMKTIHDKGLFTVLRLARKRKM